MEFKTQNSVLESIKAYLKSIGSALTDFTAGSVLHTLTSSISVAIGSLYDTLKNIYDTIFVATASEGELDKRVADFGISRKSDTTASGYATFYRNTTTDQDYTLAQGVRIKTAATSTTQGLSYETTEEKILTTSITDTVVYVEGITNYYLSERFASEIISVLGTTISGGNYEFVLGTDYELNTTSLSTNHYLSWLADGLKPLAGTNFYITYAPLSIDVPVSALTAGSAGNTGIGTVTQYVNPVNGFDNVYNFVNIIGGTDTETDDELRNRVPLYLSSLARATKNALKSAALAVEGVKSVSISEPDYPDGYIRMFIDDGSGSATEAMITAVRDAIDGTINGVISEDAEAYRAAGLYVNIEAPQKYLIIINMEIKVNAALGYNLTTVSSQIRQTIISWLASMGTGTTVYRSLLIDKIMSTSGVTDVYLPTLTINGIGEDVNGGNITVNANQVPRAETSSIFITTF